MVYDRLVYALHPLPFRACLFRGLLTDCIIDLSLGRRLAVDAPC